MNKQPYAALILHGFASSLDSVREIQPAIQSLGLPLSMPVLRGHGCESPGALHGTTWHDWLADARVALQSLLDGAGKVIVIGHSMGGLLALNLAADHPGSIDSVILAATGVQLNSPLAPGRPLHFLVPLAMRMFKKWDLPPIYTDRSRASTDTNYHWAPMDAIASFLELSSLTRSRLAEVHAPSLILQSRKDTTVAPESAEIIYGQISTPADQKRILWFNQTEHEMFRDCEREAVVGSIKEYVGVRVGPRR